MNRRKLTAIVLIGTMSGGASALGIGASSMEKNEKGPIVPRPFFSAEAQKATQYQAGGRRDPFVPPNRRLRQRPSKSEPANAAGPESGVPKVLGIVLGREGYGAILQRADGQRIFVTPGSVLKEERARVMHISDDMVSLEYQFDEHGRVRLLERSISIHRSNTTVGSPQG